MADKKPEEVQLKPLPDVKSNADDRPWWHNWSRTLYGINFYH